MSASTDAVISRAAANDHLDVAVQIIQMIRMALCSEHVCEYGVEAFLGMEASLGDVQARILAARREDNEDVDD